MQKLFKTLGVFLLGVFLTTNAQATEKAEASQFTYGGDIRLRTVSFNYIPYTLGIDARGGKNNFQRYRTRLWGNYQATDNLMFRIRAVNEFRTFVKPENHTWDSMDEVVFDNIYLDWKGNDISVRVGRQDLIYGTGKLILDGTPKDGSRTIYFNAIKASYTGLKDITIDIFAMYTPSEDELAIHSQDRDLVGKTAGGYDEEETGGGIYIKNKSCSKMPYEGYYLIKTDEEEWARPAIGVVGTGAGITHDSHTRHTIGTRLMPKFSKAFDANVELAYQFGEDTSAYMIDALANWHVQGLEKYKVKVGLGWYYLSGDDPSTTDDEHWNPLWARWPQYSELYVYSFDPDGVGHWSNISMPHAKLSITPSKNYKTDLLLGYMMAPEADAAGGDERGLLFTWWNRFTVAEKIITDTDKLSAHVLLELFDPGDYYTAAQQDETAYFFRVEMNYKF